MIDLRSDTVTRPTAAMREAMASAVVGDDVFGEDPTVCQLEERIAEQLGKQAALFVPSGTMSNQICVRLHCGPGDEFLCDRRCHIFRYEQAAYAQLFGVAAQPIDVETRLPTVDQFANRVQPDNEHCPRTRLVTLENTLNRGSGCVLPYDQVVEICDWAAACDLARHLDGARLFNAFVATGITAAKWAQHFDTVSICFSKGLGAPVGSALCGTREAITHARRIRKALGGGMRQAGIIAAGALYALEHNVDRLAEDHVKAQLLAGAIRQTAGLTLQTDIDTNIVIFDVAKSCGTAAEFCQQLHDNGVRMLAGGPQFVRAVMHLDVSMDETKEVVEIVAEVAASLRAR